MTTPREAGRRCKRVLEVVGACVTILTACAWWLMILGFFYGLPIWLLLWILGVV